MFWPPPSDVPDITDTGQKAGKMKPEFGVAER